MGIVRSSRRALLGVSRKLGVTRKIADSAWRRSRLLILCYHGVSMHDEVDWDSELFVTLEFLRRRFEILRDGGYVVLPLRDAVRMLYDGALPKRAVVITFDDGFYNFHAAAIPLLKEFQFPATVYLSSYYCINQRPLLTLTVRYLLWRARTSSLAVGALPGAPGQVNLASSADRQVLGDALASTARSLSANRSVQHAWLGDLAHKLGVDWQEFQSRRALYLMTPAEVADVASQGFDVQLHTHRHRTPRSETEFCQELLENRRIIEELTKRSAAHFCYPSGDLDPVFLPWLKDLGVETATTCAVGLARKSDNPLLLPRFIDTMHQSETMFESWLSGAAEYTGRSRR